MPSSFGQGGALGGASFGGFGGALGGGLAGGLIDTKALIAAAMANKAAATQAGALTGIGGGGGGGGFVNPATRTARRLYVGNLPPTTDQALVRRAMMGGRGMEE